MARLEDFSQLAVSYCVEEKVDGCFFLLGLSVTKEKKWATKTDARQRERKKMKKAENLPTSRADDDDEPTVDQHHQLLQLVLLPRSQPLLFLLLPFEKKGFFSW